MLKYIMRTDIYGQLILSENDLCDLYMRDPTRTLKKAYTESNISLDDILYIESKPELIEYIDPTWSIEDFDNNNQSNWYMPIEYKEIDIAKFVLDQCTTEAELQRAGEELILFQERNMFVLLQYLKYLVDIMRKHNIVWGVGRGSSVASFVLFLLGVHRINSLYYDLSIDEFIK
jgi:DNA polymerase III alpha subunit